MLRVPPFRGVRSATSNFNPLSLSPILWFRADIGVTTVSGDVSNWANQGSLGSAQDLKQTTAANRPLYNTSDANFNNKPSITFDPVVKEWLTMATFTEQNSYDYFIVLRLATGTPSNIAYTARDRMGNDAQNTHYPYTNSTIYDAAFTTARKSYTTYTPATLATTHLYEVISVSGEWTAAMNGTAVHTTATNTAGRSTNTLLGRADATTHLNGTVGEIFVSNSKLSAANRTAYKNYVKTFWGISAIV